MTMFKNLRTLLLTLTAIAVMAAPVLAPAQQGERQAAAATEFNDEFKAKVLEDMESMLTRFAFVPGVDFAGWPDLVQGRKEALDSAQTPDQFVGVVNLALREYGFSHIVLFSPQFAERRSTQRMVGLGVRIEIEEEGLRVVFTFPEGPAAQAGIISGDLIHEADGKPVRAAGDLAGEEGSKLTVKVKRDGEDLTFEVERKAFSMVIPETLKWVDDDTAMITIPTFDAGYNRRNIENLFDSAMDAKRIIVDLRNNGGGRVDNLLHLSSFFLDTSEPLGTFISRQNYESFISEHERDPENILEVAAFTQAKVRPMRRDATPFEGDIVVLINRGSGSASEMFAAAMREYREAALIGAESAGAVLASIMRPIHGNFLLQFPVTDYVTIKGRRLEGNGLEPDIEAANPRFGAEDEGVVKAMAWFSDKE